MGLLLTASQVVHQPCWFWLSACELIAFIHPDSCSNDNILPLRLGGIGPSIWHCSQSRISYALVCKSWLAGWWPGLLLGLQSSCVVFNLLVSLKAQITALPFSFCASCWLTALEAARVLWWRSIKLGRAIYRWSCWLFISSFRMVVHVMMWCPSVSEATWGFDTVQTGNTRLWISLAGRTGWSYTGCLGVGSWQLELCSCPRGQSSPSRSQAWSSHGPR